MSRVLAGRYELGQLIGRGGMATVHRARDRSLDREVAVKLISEGASKERFLIEARRTAQIRHPSVVEIFDVGEDGEAFLVMPLLEGETLQVRLDREQQLAPAEAVAIGIEVCEALSAAHTLGIVHRDIKPANLFLLAPGSPEQRRVKVLDFGVAKRIDGNTLETQPGMLVGTVSFMAPEQIKGEEIDRRCDLYSLGVVLFRCLSGELPFQRGNVASMIHAHLSTPPPHLSLAEPVLARLDAVLQRLLSKSPAERPADAANTRAALASALSGESTEAELELLSTPLSVPALAAFELGTPAEVVETRAEPSSEHGAGTIDFEIDQRPVPATHVPPNLPVLEQWSPAPIQRAARPPEGFLEGIPTEVSKRIAGYGALTVLLYLIFFRFSLWVLLPLIGVSVFGLVAYVKATNR